MAWDEAGDGPRDDWLFEGGTKGYKMVGKSSKRKKLSSFHQPRTFRGPDTALRKASEN